MDTRLYSPNEWPAVSFPYDIPEDVVRLRGRRSPLRGRVETPAPTDARMERRSMPRYALNCTAVALVGSDAEKFRNICKMSLAEIACAVFKSNPVSIGEITDINMQGMAFQYIERPERPDNFTHLDILVAENDFYLRDLQVKVISDVAVPEDIRLGSFKTRRTGVRFIDLDADQKSALHTFIRNFTSRVPLTH